MHGWAAFDVKGTRREEALEESLSWSLRALELDKATKAGTVPSFDHSQHDVACFSALGVTLREPDGVKVMYRKTLTPRAGADTLGYDQKC